MTPARTITEHRHRQLRVPHRRLQRGALQLGVLQGHAVRRADRARTAGLRGLRGPQLRVGRQRRHADRAAWDRRLEDAQARQARRHRADGVGGDRQAPDQQAGPRRRHCRAADAQPARRGRPADDRDAALPNATPRRNRRGLHAQRREPADPRRRPAVRRRGAAPACRRLGARRRLPRARFPAAR